MTSPPKLDRTRVRISVDVEKLEQEELTNLVDRLLHQLPSQSDQLKAANW
jgi:hypothetical protein